MTLDMDQNPPKLETLRPADARPGSSLSAGLLALNNAHASELSWLEPARLLHLLDQSRLAYRIGEVDAFMLVLDESANYDSPNFGWFRARHSRFLYVDRIVVAPHARGRGLARHLYGALIREATRAKHARIVCEVNIDPPNPSSDAFHAALGFAEIGRASIHGGAKTVRYLERLLSEDGRRAPDQAAEAGGSASTE
jgi:predicted GNAT superfamily acetyltransferase